MASVFDRPSLWRRASPLLRGFDGPLAFAVFLLACAGLLAMYSSGYDHRQRALPTMAATCCWPVS
jgi:rod shape determining protein RodA